MPRVEDPAKVFVQAEIWPYEEEVFVAAVFLGEDDVVQLRGILDAAARRKLANPTFAQALSAQLAQVAR